MLSFWFSGVAAAAWTLVALLQFRHGDQEFGLLAALAALCFAVAFLLRLRERRLGVRALGHGPVSSFGT